MVKIEILLKIITYLCVLTGVASVAQYIEPLYAAGFAVLLALSIHYDFRGASPLPRWLLNLVSVLVLVPSLARVNSESLIEPILNALMILAAIKLLENKKFRDYMQIFMICMFLLIGSSLISLSVLFLVYFCILLAFSTVSLMFLAYFSHDPNISISRDNARKILYQALLVCCIAIPASSFFFLILPRTNLPLFSFLNKFAHARSGFSDSISLGGVSDIQEDSTVIFRAEMEQVPEHNLYWRGIELDEFDGAVWRRSPNPPETWGEPPPGKQVVQVIYLEPYGNRYLFALDKPLGIYPAGRGSWRKQTNIWREPVFERISYKAVSVPSDFSPRANIDRPRYLQLPAPVSPRILELVEKVIASRPDADPAQTLVRFLKFGDYAYSMVGLPASDAPLEEFLFQGKRVNCEYFASALAVMLRSSVIPARLVGGYRGGYYNRAGRYYMVLQKNAHVWVEAYAPEKGWVRLDPTPYTSENPALAYGDSLILRLKLMMDTFNYYWDKFVISYDLGQQLAILKKIGSTLKNPEIEIGLNRKEMARYAVWLLAALVACAGSFFGVRAARRSREERLISRFSRRMAARGYERKRSEGLEEFVSRVSQPELRERAEEFVRDFEKFFYKDRPITREHSAHLREQIRRL